MFFLKKKRKEKGSESLIASIELCVSLILTSKERPLVKFEVGFVFFSVWIKNDACNEPWLGLIFLVQNTFRAEPSSGPFLGRALLRPRTQLKGLPNELNSRPRPNLIPSSWVLVNKITLKLLKLTSFFHLLI